MPTTHTIWLLTGSPENFITGIARGFWGLSGNPRNLKLWEQVNGGDIAIFHSTQKSAIYDKPEPLIIGYAVIGEKFYKKRELWWIDEVKSNVNKWPHVFSLDDIHIHQDSAHIKFDDHIKSSTLPYEGLDELGDKIYALGKSAVKYKDFKEKSQRLFPDIKKFTDQKSIQVIDKKYYEYLCTLKFVKYNR